VKLFLSILLAGTVTASAAPLDITGAWFRSLPGKLPAAGYFTAQNNTSHDIAITGARAEGCGMLMMHQSTNTGGMSGMDMAEKVTVPAGGAIKFSPGGYHLMCTDAHLKIGTKAPVLLNLSDGTAVAVAFQVRNATGK
jgi:periplasmic copper chaperone A